jgi:hypothetical protein
MQIHELTKKKQVELEEGIIDGAGALAGKAVSGVKNVGSAIASPFKDIAGGYKDARMDQKVSALADKAYRSWKSYESQLLKATPNARQTGELKQALLAFVNKNLLGGMYLPNVINKDKITGLVDQIASGGQPASTTSGAQPPIRTGGKVAGQVSQTPGAIAKRNARAQGTQANAAGVGAIGQMANQLGGTTPNTMANAPVSRTNTAKPSNPNQPQQTPLQQATALQQQVQGQKPSATFGKVPSTTARATPGQMPAGVAGSAQGKTMQKAYGKPRGGIQGMKSDLEEAAPANEKDLFKQLVQQAGLAQTSAPGAGAGNTTGQSTTAPGSTRVNPQDANGMAQTLKQQLDPAIVKGLPALSATVRKLTGTNQVKSTGNPGADGLLILMGFQGL